MEKAKIIRSNSETNFYHIKKKIEVLNNNLKLLKDPINNKECQAKRKISRKLTISANTRNTDTNKTTSISKSTFSVAKLQDNPNLLKSNILKVIMLKTSYERFLRKIFTNKSSQVFLIR